MREKTSKIVLLLLSGALLPVAALAKPAKPSHARIAASAHTARHSETERAVAHPHERSAKSGVRREEKVATHEKPRSILDLRHAHWVTKARPFEASAPEHRLAGQRVDAGRSQESAPRRAPIQQVRVEAPAQATEQSEALPRIEVHHNRKIHLTPEAAPTAAVPIADGAPRKATVQDFLFSPETSPATSDAESPASAAPAVSGAPVSRPARIAVQSVVERKLPVVKPVPEIVPDPVTEPVLYTSRGRLIVPPAMKGSHEILLHQNEMADRDGLERIQDDEDLERLRGVKRLVEIPVGSALEVDERLPVNRRYCRPWTAQFLASLARAHYARFHTPLQVNSAVRTVEFQERLRYTNGNAAPAEGETASPHLTGQAVDLAKHGLSMTEIAWLRGYLMPLVQQGKVDVEEEFQQSCFHISVYKKYTPQAVPKREIPNRRGTASALAAAVR